MQERSAAPSALSAGAAMLENRLRKNLRRLAPWLRRAEISCYRAYDADLPEYSAAIDVYTGVDDSRWLHVQEYRAPKEIPLEAAEQRLGEIVATAMRVFEVPEERVALKTRERGKGGSKYGHFALRGERMMVREGAAQLIVNLFDYLDTGLFLDHRPMRRRLAAAAPGMRVLNLFCYTGAATVQAIVGDAASTVSVDLSNTYLEWAEDNLALNGADSSRHRLVRADVREWLAASDEPFDLIFCDPPTFSNSKRAEDFDVQRDHAEVLRSALRLLTPSGELFFSTNARRFQLDEAALADQAAIDDLRGRTLDPDFARDPKIHHVWRLRHRAE